VSIFAVRGMQSALGCGCVILDKDNTTLRSERERESYLIEPCVGRGFSCSRSLSMPCKPRCFYFQFCEVGLIHVLDKRNEPNFARGQHSGGLLELIFYI